MNSIKKVMLLTALSVFLSGFYSSAVFGTTETKPELPVKNMVTMIDLGAKKCIPCKMMAPILADLEKEYKGKAAIIFIDVWQKENKEQIKKFKIRSIPTQIFFDKSGKEVYRHIGFMDKKSIVDMLKKLGVN